MLRESVTRGQAFAADPAAFLYPKGKGRGVQGKGAQFAGPAASIVEVGCIRLAHVAGATHRCVLCESITRGQPPAASSSSSLGSKPAAKQPSTSSIGTRSRKRIHDSDSDDSGPCEMQVYHC